MWGGGAQEERPGHSAACGTEWVFQEARGLGKCDTGTQSHEQGWGCGTTELRVGRGQGRKGAGSGSLSAPGAGAQVWGHREQHLATAMTDLCPALLSRGGCEHL